MKIEMDRLVRVFNVKMTLYSKDVDMSLAKHYDKSGEFPIFQYSIIDTIFSYYNSKLYMKIGSKYYNPSDRIKLSNCNEMYRGHHQVTHLLQNGNSVNIDSSYGLFIESMTVSNFVEKLFNNGFIRNFDLKRYEDKEGNCCLDMKQLRQLKGELISYKVICNHQGYNREYKIMDISQKSACEMKFKDSKGNYIYVIDYFKSQYNIKLKYPSLPCLLLGNNKVAMPMELCLIKDGQKRIKKISDLMQLEMVQKTSVKPSERKKIILKILKENEDLYKNIEKETGIKLITNFTECNAKKLDEPLIRYANKDMETNNGSWNQKGIKLLKPVKIVYIILYLLLLLLYFIIIIIYREIGLLLIMIFNLIVIIF